MTTSNEHGKEPLASAKADMALAADQLVEVATRHATNAIAGLASQIRVSAHETSAAFSDDLHRLSEAVASGLRDVKAELTVPQSVKEHPYAWLAGGLAVGAAGLLVLRSFTRPAPRSIARAGLSGGLGGKIALTALDVGLTMWLAKRQRNRASVTVSPTSVENLH